MRRFHIGEEPQPQNAEGQRRQKHPSYEAQLKYEQPPLVALHHRLRALHRLNDAHVRVVRRDVERHGVSVRRYYAGDYEKQRPEKYLYEYIEKQPRDLQKPAYGREHIAHPRLLSPRYAKINEHSAHNDGRKHDGHNQTERFISAHNGRVGLKLNAVHRIVGVKIQLLVKGKRRNTA